MSDHPDYFGQPQFPSYGSAKYNEDDDTGDANSVTTLFTVSGKGVSYGGYLYSEDANHKLTNEFQIFIDGSWFFSGNFSKQIARNLFVGVDLPIYLIAHETLTPRFVYGIKPGLTFSTSFAIKYVERHGNEVEVGWYFIYALVE